MDSLTGVSGGEWLFLFVLAVAATLIVSAFVEARPGLPRTRRPLLSLLTGSALLGVALVWHGDLVPRLLKRVVTRPWALAGAVGISILALALCDLVLHRAVALFRRLLFRFHPSGSVSQNGALGLSFALLLVFGVAGLAAANRAGGVAPVTPNPTVGGIQMGEGARIVASYDVPGSVMELVFRGTRDGFLSMADGRILHFRLPDALNGRLKLTTVAGGVGYPRGLAIIGNQLFVSDVVGLPCKPPWQFCAGPNVGPTPEAGELKILQSARGRILAFDIGPSGSLANERVILGNLPTVSSLHAVNGLAVGPDGLLYAVIGNIDYLWKTPHAIDRLDVPNLDLLGTIVRLAPDGSHLQIFARGIRNIYDLAFDERGSLYGGDNDGYTVGGWRREELLHIRQGANYGYPFEGTSGKATAPGDQPLWILDTKGTAAITWQGRLGLSPGLLLGSCGKIQSVRLTDLGHGHGRVVDSDGDVTTLADQIPGCVTAIEPGPDRLALVSIFPGGTQPFPLLLMDLSGVK